MGMKRIDDDDGENGRDGDDKDGKHDSQRFKGSNESKSKSVLNKHEAADNLYTTKEKLNERSNSNVQ